MDRGAVEDAEDAAGASIVERWRDVGVLLARLSPTLLRSMLLAAEVTAVALSTVRERNIS